MVILVTGSAGFIGSNICKKLLRLKNTTVVGIDNYNSYYSPDLKKRRIGELKKHGSFEFIQSSFFQKSTLIAVQKKYKPTVLIHAAAEVGVRNGEADPVRYIQTNSLGTATLLEIIGRGLKHAVLFSSSSVYGNTRLPFTETSRLRPISVYGVSKATMEQYAYNFYARTSIPITIVRPFSVYGPDGRPDMLPMKMLFTSASGHTMDITGSFAKRDWTFIDDLTLAVLTIMKKPSGFSFVNIGFGKPISNKQVVKIAENIIKHYGYALTHRFLALNPIEMPGTWADTTILKKSYNVTMPTPFNVGFKKTADFFFSHKHLYGYNS